MHNDCSGPLGEQFSDTVLTDAFVYMVAVIYVRFLTPVEHVNLVQKVILIV